VRYMPAVTIIIPVFNAERYIGDALDSICGQVFRDSEVIVVDDGSTDRTLAVVDKYRDSLDLSVYMQTNSGPAAARNNGIRQARGRYCAFLDADDVMLPELLSEQIALFNSKPNLGLVFTDIATFDERGTISPARWGFSESSPENILDRLLLENFVTTSAAMASKECLLHVGLFSENRLVAEDYELWLRLAVRWGVGIVPRPLVRYRYIANSLSSDKLYSAQCALNVVETFWAEHQEYLRSHARVYLCSLSRHLSNAGNAALAAGRSREAWKYFLMSLKHNPVVFPAWRGLAKTVLHTIGLGKRG
jgi:glycosyltransferase involved in cell wall biosynthesis